MRLVKWIFFSYLALMALLVAGLAVAPSLLSEPPLDRDTVYLPYFGDVKTFDPRDISDTIASAIGGNIFECLYNYRHDTEKGVLYPELAEDFPQVSDDLLVYTVRIRKGIHYYDPDKTVFADGEGPEVKAQDFIHAWKRILDFKAASPNAQIFADKIKGADAWREYTRTTDAQKIEWDRPIEGLAAPDDHTLRITLAEPSPQLIYIMAHLPTTPVPKAVVEKWGEDIRDHPIGTGAYCMKFNENAKQQSIILRANPVYRGRPDVDGFATVDPAQRIPKIRNVQFSYFTEELPAWFQFRKGRFDSMGIIPKEIFTQAVRFNGEVSPDMAAAGIGVVQMPSPSTRYLGFNMKDPLFANNKPLRQAMSMAINRKQHLEVYWNGKGVPASGPIPPGMDLYDSKAVNPYTQYNPEAARAKLKEAERIHGGGIPKITLLLPGTDSLTRQEGEFFCHAFRALGLDVELDATNWARFQDLTDRHLAQFFYNGWVADWPDEQNFFQLFYSKNCDDGGVNSTLYSNPEFDRLYEQSSKMLPGKERLEIYRKMQEIVNEDCTWICVYYDVYFLPRHVWMSGFVENDYCHGVRIFTTLDADLRQKYLDKMNGKVR
ncbi:MAG: ABC transporter substrate-binding protein [Tepidisphaeraceae bacterium]|jgi:ABC-type transport system substrate-binding protein